MQACMPWGQLRASPDWHGARLTSSDVCMIAGLCVFELRACATAFHITLRSKALEVGHLLSADRIDFSLSGLRPTDALLLARLVSFNEPLTYLE